MNPTIRAIRSAAPQGAADTLTAAQLVAAAFADLDVNRWLVDDPTQLMAITTAYFRIWAEHAADGYGTVLLAETNTGTAVGTAVWFDYTLLPDKQPEPPADYNTRLATATGDYAHRFRLLDHQMSQAHPHEQPHWYLAYLAVRPDHQGHGVGSALLEHSLTPMMASGRCAYLEATNPHNAALYERHGFEPMDPPRLCVGEPGGGLTFLPMWAPSLHTDRNRDHEPGHSAGAPPPG